MVPQTEARTAVPRAAVRDSLVVGAPLTATGLQLSVVQQVSAVDMVTLSRVELVVPAVQPAKQPWLLKPVKPEMLGNVDVAVKQLSVLFSVQVVFAELRQ